MLKLASLHDSGQGCMSQVAMGHRLVIPDLARDGSYGLDLFSQAGFRSLIAVPIRTYRTHGVLGVASRTRKRFPKESDELLTIIAGMVGTAINTAELSQITLASQERRLAKVNRPYAYRNADGDTGRKKISPEETGADDFSEIAMDLSVPVIVGESRTVTAEDESGEPPFIEALSGAGVVREREAGLAEGVTFSVPAGVSRLTGEEARRIGRDMLKASLLSLGKVSGALHDGDTSVGKDRVAVPDNDYDQHTRKMTDFRGTHRSEKRYRRGKP
jgi:hypothetical protein